MNNKILTQSLSAFRIILISSLTIFTLYTVQAWVSPTVSAPNGNVGGPLTTATTTQVKTGSLGLLGGLSVGSLITANAGITATGKIIANGGFQLITGAASGTVLTSDMNGNTKWTATSSLGISGINGTLLNVGPTGVNDGGAGWDAECPVGYLMHGLYVMGNTMVVRCTKI